MTRQNRIFASLIVAAVVAAILALTIAPKTTIAESPRIRRTILLTFKPEATDADIQKVFKDVKDTITKLKGVHNVFIGRQTNERAPFKYGISMDFDDEAALKAYRTDQEHRRTHNDYNHLIEQAQITDIRDE